MKTAEYITYYTPICKDKYGYFQVNGATKTSYDEAVREAKKHVAFREKDAEIVRVDEYKERV